MEEQKKKIKGKRILYLLSAIVIFLAGILIGIQIEKNRAAEGLATANVTPTQMVAPSPTAGSLPTPMMTTTVSTPGPTLTVVPSMELTGTAAPSMTPAPTATVTAVATATPTPTIAITPTPTPTPTNVPIVSTETADFYGALQVKGTKLADSEGNTVQLRGISTHGLGWFPEYVNAALIKQLREEWGCNVFRLAMYTAEHNGYCSSGSDQKENLKKLIDIGVQAAVENEMYVIIDWHILSDSNPNTNKDEAKKFFAEMAKKYAAYPNVLYEICNEPNGGTSWADIKKYALEVIPVIREAAPEAVIIVGTPTWSQDVDLAAANPITEYDNLMYALHFYAATHKDSLRQKCKTAVQKGLPIFVTEYGICDASGNGAIDEVQANKWIELLDGYGISHVAWNLSNKSETSAMIKTGCGKTSGFSADDLSAGGTWFVAMMKGEGYTLEGSIDVNQNENESSSETVTTDYAAYVKELFANTEGVIVTASNGWNSEHGIGLQLDITIENKTNSEIKDWQRTLTLQEGVRATISQSWNATVTIAGTSLLLQPADYNKTIPAGGTISGIGVILEVEQ